MDSARRLLAMLRKEFRQIRRDPGTLAVLVVLPLFLLVLFGYAISLDVKDIKLSVWDLDRSPQSRAYQEVFFQSGYFSRVDGPATAAQRDELLDKGRALLVLTIPPGFGAELAAGRRAPAQFLLDGSNSTTASTALGYLQGANASYAAGLGRGLSRGPVPSADPSAARPIVDLRSRVVYNQELKSVNSLVPGLIVLILTLSSVISTALALVREKEHGTMEQLSVSPLNSLELIVGKTLPYLLIALLSAVLVLASGRLVFGVEVRGSYLLLAFETLLFLFASLGLGILISSAVDTQQAAFMIGAMVTILPSFILSGFIFPIRNMPPPIQWVTEIFPARHYLDALRSLMMKDSGFLALWGDSWRLALIAAATLGLSALRLSRSRI